MRQLTVDLAARSFELTNEDALGPVEWGLDHLEESRAGRAFLLGAGPLAASGLPGLARLVLPNYSELWDGFFISTMGGCAVALVRAGLDAVMIRGQAEGPTVLRIMNLDQVEVDQHELVPAGLEEVFAGYRGLEGTRGLQQYILDRQARPFLEAKAKFRIIAAGPAATKTRMGALCATLVSRGELVPGLDSWGGRGGMGSRLAQEHNVVGLIYGGTVKPERPLRSELDALFREGLGEPMLKVVKEATRIYTYDSAIGTGGTFGANLSSLGDRFVSFNWSSVDLPDETRARMFDEWIEGHYLRQFNDEIVAERTFRTCGEACPVRCRKYDPARERKKDYEPYEANGPNAGVFDHRAAERLVERIDTLGFDAIEAGNTISWVMEMLHRGVIDGRDFGLTRTPDFDPERFDLIESSRRNADLGLEIADLLLEHDLFRGGIRQAATDLGREATDLAVYTPHGEGAITPCVYWIPAYLLPIAIQGKFLSDYTTDFKEPRALGYDSTVRMIKEMYFDNLGGCRFHSAWLESMAPLLVDRLLQRPIDLYEYSRSLVRRIYRQTSPASVHNWESARVYRILRGFVERHLRDAPDDEALRRWAARFRADEAGASREYWAEVTRGIRDALAASSTPTPKDGACD